MDSLVCSGNPSPPYFPTQLTAPGSLRMALFKYQHMGTLIWGFVLFVSVDVITLSDEEEITGMFLLLN